MPWKKFGRAELEALVRRLRLEAQHGRALFDLLARACRRKVRREHAAVCHSFVRALATCRPEALRSWEDVEAFREAMRGRLGASDEKLAVRGLRMVAGELVRGGQLPRRIRHRARGRCSSCGRTKRIENVRRMLCPDCVGAKTARARFDRCCARFSDVEGPAAEILRTLVEYERRAAPGPRAFSRVWALGSFLSEHPDVPALRTWPDVLALRAAIQSDPMRGRRHQALWALHKVVGVLVERGVLEPRPSQSMGPLPDRLEAIWKRFHVTDPIRRDRLRTLIDYFEETRVTVTAVQTAQAFAYYLGRHEAGPVRSWDDIDAHARSAPGPGARWHRRIQTALRRLGDALEAKGRIAPRPVYDALPRILEGLHDLPGEVHAINVRFVTSLHDHQRRPITLRHYVRELNRFWTWAVAQGIRHPAQVSPEAVKSYRRALRRRGRDADMIDGIQVSLRGYFDWLRRERLVLARPVPTRERPRLCFVRICERVAFEKLIAAIGAGILPPREALVLYLLVFHALRNHELVEATAIGFRTHGSFATFDIGLPAPILSVGQRHIGRRSQVLHLPTGRYPWLHDIVTSVTAERAALLKRPDNPYLLVSKSWRQANRPMHPHVVDRLVARATRTVLGTAMTPTLVRQSAGAYMADLSDHTICCAMGWSPARAVDLAYGTREVVAHSVAATC